MKNNSHPLIKSAMILTLAGLISKIAGFYYKIFLVSLVGAEGIGIYQMVFPLYILCVSLASAGIQTAISRFTAEKRSTEGPAVARSLFHTGLLLALGISLLLSLLLFSLAEPITLRLLGEKRCIPLLRLMALAIPFETIHCCITAWFLGQKKSAFPAVSQLLEQAVRILATFLLYQIFLQNHRMASPSLAAGGLLCAEITAALFSLTVIILPAKTARRTDKTAALQRKTAGNASFCRNTALILTVALPVTGNRLLLNLLQSAEAALLPARLASYYQNTSVALSAYGIFSGMAIPLILLPCAITGSFSMLLLPSVSEARAQKNDAKIADIVRSSLTLCLFMGILCTGAFLLFGRSLGMLLYKEERVGSYLMTLAWICPFLYMTTMMNSILHGLGKTTQVLLHSLAGISLRLLFVLLFVPYFGIRGCLWGLLAGQLTSSFLSIASLRRTVRFSFDPAFGILLPAACCLAASLLLCGLRRLLPLLALEESWCSLILSAGIWGCTALLLMKPAFQKLLTQPSSYKS